MSKMKKKRCRFCGKMLRVVTDSRSKGPFGWIKRRNETELIYSCINGNCSGKSKSGEDVQLKKRKRGDPPRRERRPGGF